MTRRERLMATLNGKPVDRPAVSFYEIGGFKIDPANPDPYNIYNSPDWQPLLQLAYEKTDIIRMMRPVRSRSVNPAGSAGNPVWSEFFNIEKWEDNNCRITKTTLNVAGRTMTEVTKREMELDTVWTTEHLLKSNDDVKAYLQIPDEAFAESINIELLEAEEELVGDSGIVMVDSKDPLCAAAALFSMEDYTIFALTEPELFGQLLDKCAKYIHSRTEEVSEKFPGRLWRICGPEYAGEPYLPPRLFEEYVVKYDTPMIDAIHKNGGFARVHSHGKLKNILKHIVDMGADGLDPIEPPPQGDVELSYVREQYGDQMVLFGNIEVTDIENLPEEQFREKVKRAIDEGTAGEGRGFVLLPSACPYGRKLPLLAMKNYEKMIEIIEMM